MVPTFIAVLLVAYLMTSGLVGSRVDELSAYGNGDALDAVFQTLNAPDNRATKFLRYCYDLFLHGDMGTTGRGANVREEVTFRMKYTGLLAVLGFGASVLLGIPLGFVAAVNHNKWPDHTVSFVSAFLASIPSYCLALFLVLLFCLWLNLLPIYGIDTWKHYVMPTIVLGTGGMSLTSRMTRSAVLEILSKPYLTVLRAKGLTERKIFFPHVLKNAVIPILSVVGNIAVAVLCSTLVVENFFSIPGIGSYLVAAVEQRNQYRLLGCIVVLSLVIIAINFLVDVFSALCDPKFRLQLHKQCRSSDRKGVPV